MPNLSLSYDSQLLHLYAGRWDGSRSHRSPQRQVYVPKKSFLEDQAEHGWVDGDLSGFLQPDGASTEDTNSTSTEEEESNDRDAFFGMSSLPQMLTSEDGPSTEEELDATLRFRAEGSEDWRADSSRKSPMPPPSFPPAPPTCVAAFVHP